MADWWSLSELACRPPDARRRVALRADGGHLSHADLLRRVACWQSVFSARPESHCAIYFNDPFDHMLEVTSYDHLLIRAALER